MISSQLIRTDIPTLDLIYGECKAKFYELDRSLDALPEDTSEDSAEYKELSATYLAFAYIYNEIDRVLYERKRLTEAGHVFEVTK